MKTFIASVLIFCFLCSCGTTSGTRVRDNSGDVTGNAGKAHTAKTQKTSDVAAAKTPKGGTLPMGKVKKNAVPATELAQDEPVEDVPQELPNVTFAKSLKERLAASDIDGAIDCFAEMPESLQEDVDLQVLHASLLLSSGRSKEAGALGDKLLAAYGQSIDVLELSAAIAGVQGDNKKQDAILAQILKAEPLNVSANVQKGQIEAARHKYRLAYNYYKTALKGDSKSVDALFGCGQMSYYNGSLSESKKYFTSILEQDPKNDAALAYLGKLAAEDENYLSAAKYVEKAIAVNPNDYNHQIDYGKYLRSLGRFDDAAKAWTQAAAIKPDYFLAYTYRASLRQERKQYKEALSDYYNVVRTNPKYYFAYEEIGMLEWHAGRMDKCRAGFLKASEVNKNDWSYQLLIAATYIKEKNLVDMKKYLASCMKTMDRNSEEYLMVRLYHDQGTVNAEMQLKNKIAKVENVSKRGKLLFYMGLYYDMRGNTELAEDFYTQVVAMQAPMFFEYQMAEWGVGK